MLLNSDWRKLELVLVAMLGFSDELQSPNLILVDIGLISVWEKILKSFNLRHRRGV